jgi:hypothetical protein
VESPEAAHGRDYGDNRETGATEVPSGVARLTNYETAILVFLPEMFRDD